MGVKRLLKNLDPILLNVNLFNLNIERIGIDGHHWIHECIKDCKEDFLIWNNINKIADSIQMKLKILLDLGRINQVLM
jgi:hypothetical protein